MPGINCKPRMEPPLASTRRLSTIRWAQRVAQVCPPSAEDRVSDRTLNLPAL